MLTERTALKQHLGLLERYWKASCCSSRDAPPFARSSPLWRERGGFSSDEAPAELRCTGELGLRCLVFFAENCQAEASMMKRRRGGYPFVKAATALVRVLCEVLHVIDETGLVSDFPVTRAFFWHVIQDEDSFYRLFALLFMHFEELYCEQVAKDRRLLDTDVCSIGLVVKLVDEAKQHLEAALRQAPSGLDDLKTMCTNGSFVLATKKPKSTFVGEPIVSSRWRDHFTQRKSMRELGRSWGKDHKSSDAKAGKRLTPRVPEIVKGNESEQQMSASTGSTESTAASSSSLSELKDGSTDKKIRIEAFGKNLFEGLIVTESRVEVPTRKTGSNGSRMRLAAPTS